ncbi:MAG: acyl-CoA dehydrogenase [Burkholderiaceae bacterium]
MFIFVVLLAISATVLWFWKSPNQRRNLLTRPIYAAFKKALPSMSETERAALEAGTVWIEADIFKGRPDFHRLAALPAPKLTAEEESFLNNEVVEACRLVNDWTVSHETYDMSPEAWQYIKDKGFLGMIIPKAYGGLAFSAYAQSQIIARLSTRSSPLAVSVMVPNSLGPGELLLHYGTQEQKQHYLPRLAKGIEVPAFALTSPWAGSDAAAIPDVGIVCKGQWQGKEVLGMRVSWNKRYITLAPVCTVLGLAFRLYDPEKLLGGQEDIGITCALVPRDHPGVVIGRRHIPLNTFFMNGPTQGSDVFMPLEFIIGGPAMAGQGWRMLMECLSAGRGISLPSANAGISQLVSFYAGGYSRVRSQFKTPIARFEGIEEPLARIAGYTYLNNAIRTLSAMAIDLGEKPSIVSAIAKYHVTERARTVVNDGMDIVGGKGICQGPSNPLGMAYQQMPVSITVEGANILTRSLIIFGQGAVRCHPYVLAEMQAARMNNEEGLAQFDKAFWSHVGFAMTNGAKALGHGLTRGFFARPHGPVPSAFHAEARKLVQFSVAFAFLADMAMLSLGGSLKRKEKISARLGDILSMLFAASCAIKQYELLGQPASLKATAQWAVRDCLYKAAQAFGAVLANYPSRILGRLLAAWLFPLGMGQRPPSDELGRRAAASISSPGEARDMLTALCVGTDQFKDPVTALQKALDALLKAEPIDARIRAAEKTGLFQGHPLANVRDLPKLAAEKGVITRDELEQLLERDRLRDEVIHVDDFPFTIHESQQAAPSTTKAGKTTNRQKAAQPDAHATRASDTPETPTPSERKAA